MFLRFFIFILLRKRDDAFISYVRNGHMVGKVLALILLFSFRCWCCGLPRRFTFGVHFRFHQSLAFIANANNFLFHFVFRAYHFILFAGVAIFIFMCNTCRLVIETTPIQNLCFIYFFDFYRFLRDENVLITFMTLFMSVCVMHANDRPS